MAAACSSFVSSASSSSFTPPSQSRSVRCPPRPPRQAAAAPLLPLHRPAFYIAPSLEQGTSARCWPRPSSSPWIGAKLRLPALARFFFELRRRRPSCRRAWPPPRPVRCTLNLPPARRSSASTAGAMLARCRRR